jgi:hypothetical protein
MPVIIYFIYILHADNIQLQTFVEVNMSFY